MYGTFNVMMLALCNLNSLFIKLYCYTQNTNCFPCRTTIQGQENRPRIKLNTFIVLVVKIIEIIKMTVGIVCHVEFLKLNHEAIAWKIMLSDYLAGVCHYT